MVLLGEEEFLGFDFLTELSLGGQVNQDETLQDVVVEHQVNSSRNA